MSPSRSNRPPGVKKAVRAWRRLKASIDAVMEDVEVELDSDLWWVGRWLGCPVAMIRGKSEGITETAAVVKC